MLRAMFLLIACVSVAAQTAANADFSTTRLGGIGPVRIGMTLSELDKALHTSYAKPTDPDEQACTYVEVTHQPGIALMMLDGRVARVDVDNKFTRTVEGIHNGDSEARAIRAYGKRLKVEPDYYDPENSHYLTMLPANGKLGIRFEATEGKIRRYYAGTRAAISFVEGCS